MTTDKEFEKQFQQQQSWWRFKRATDTHRFPYRATFLIFFLGPALHIDTLYLALVWVGYFVCDFIEHMARQKALDKTWNETIEYQAESDSEDPGARLPKELQAAVFRVGLLLRLMLHSA